MAAGSVVAHWRRCACQTVSVGPSIVIPCLNPVASLRIALKGGGAHSLCNIVIKISSRENCY